MAKVLKANDMNKCIGCLTCMLICSGVNHRDFSLQKSSISIRTSGGLSGRFISVICQACHNPQCAEVCPSDALTPRKGGGVLLDPKKCIGCRRCVEACIVGAIEFDETGQKPIVCRHCGVCTRYCPHGCLSMKEAAD